MMKVAEKEHFGKEQLSSARKMQNVKWKNNFNKNIINLNNIFEITGEI